MHDFILIGLVVLVNAVAWLSRKNGYDSGYDIGYLHGRDDEANANVAYSETDTTV